MTTGGSDANIIRGGKFTPRNGDQVLAGGELWIVDEVDRAWRVVLRNEAGHYRIISDAIKMDVHSFSICADDHCARWEL